MLKKYREEIDRIDENLRQLLIDRFECSKKIGYYKQESGLALEHKDREIEILNVAENLPYGEHVFAVYQKILEESKRVQQELSCTD